MLNEPGMPYPPGGGEGQPCDEHHTMFMTDTLIITHERSRKYLYALVDIYSFFQPQIQTGATWAQ